MLYCYLLPDVRCKCKSATTSSTVIYLEYIIGDNPTYVIGLNIINMRKTKFLKDERSWLTLSWVCLRTNFVKLHGAWGVDSTSGALADYKVYYLDKHVFTAEMWRGLVPLEGTVDPETQYFPQFICTNMTTNKISELYSLIELLCKNGVTFYRGW